MVAELTWPPNRPRFSDRDASLEMFVQRINVIVRSHTNERIATMTKQRNTRNINRYKRKKKRKKVQGKESGTPRRDHGKSGSKPLNKRIRVPVHGFVSEAGNRFLVEFVLAHRPFDEEWTRTRRRNEHRVPTLREFKANCYFNNLASPTKRLCLANP